MHVRKKIRDGFKNVLSNLKNDPSFPKLFIFTNPVTPIIKNELPCIVITTEGETIDYESPNYPRLQVRTLEINVCAVVRNNENYEDVLDDLVLKIENELGKEENKTLGGIINWKELKEQKPDYDSFDENQASMRIVYEVIYRTLENDNSTNY